MSFLGPHIEKGKNLDLFDVYYLVSPELFSRDKYLYEISFLDGKDV